MYLVKMVNTLGVEDFYSCTDRDNLELFIKEVSEGVHDEPKISYAFMPEPWVKIR
jgi:hypothetical protein